MHLNDTMVTVINAIGALLLTLQLCKERQVNIFQSIYDQN